MPDDLAIVSVCRSLPNSDDPSSGIFVKRRLDAMNSVASVTAIQPIPYFPWVLPTPEWSKNKERTSDGLRIVQLPMFYVPKFLKSLDGFWLYRSILRELARLQALGACDVIDAHFGYPEGVGAYLAARKLGIPVFITLRGFEVEYLKKSIIGRQIRYVMQNADGCICVSHFLKGVALENGVRSDKIQVIHNAIDRSAFFPGDRQSARKKWGREEDGRIVVSVGHLIPRKRHHVLIRAFAQIKREFNNTKLVIIGSKDADSGYTRRILREIDDLDLADSVDLVGNVSAEEVAGLLQSADLFALGTSREGCCNAVLEALACGVPVVTTPVGDNAWFVKDGKSGYLTAVDDERALADAISASLRKVWEPSTISNDLEVLGWHDVAKSAIEFMHHRMRAG